MSVPVMLVLSSGCGLLSIAGVGVNRSRANRLLTGTWDNGAGNGICSNPASGSVKGDEGDVGCG